MLEILPTSLFFFASAGSSKVPSAPTVSGALLGFTAWLMDNGYPKCSISGNC